MIDTLRTQLLKLHRRVEGATAVEYGIMVALIAVVIIVAVALLGENLADMFQGVAETVGAAGS